MRASSRVIHAKYSSSTLSYCRTIPRGSTSRIGLPNHHERRTIGRDARRRNAPAPFAEYVKGGGVQRTLRATPCGALVRGSSNMGRARGKRARFFWRACRVVVVRARARVRMRAVISAAAAKLTRMIHPTAIASAVVVIHIEWLS